MKATTPAWLVVKLGDDLNWWLSESSDELGGDAAPRGVLDPRETAHLVTALEEYREFGLDDNQFSAAFQVYAVESELSDGRLRLARADANIYNTSDQLFALPLPAYDEFLEALSSAHIRQLNARHHFAHACTTEEMFDELDTLDNDRFFNADQIHVFDEINEILEWDPAEWDDSSSS